MFNRGFARPVVADLAPNEIRQAAKESGDGIRRLVDDLPPSPERDELLGMMNTMADFWDRASETFLLQWLMVAMKSAEEGFHRA